ncbi:LysR family transcriptional regulator [Shimia sp. R11_0]|uniref:LysR family transcriptional regulator n=1 Tax=Shimia sp. R11_0 TaxID=2821096 RepID=UPI001ADC6F4F|nr:LysR family transcriptional regulator [Shimia sp. R11_0]MBO9478046.1 LysR family transcriptional regulator [Shimia sp. R11_0]
MAQITFKQLEAFTAVADLGSFRRAADRLNTTQPNISTRIAALETQLGHVVMVRDAGSVRLTPMGETLLKEARNVLRAMDTLLLTANDDGLFEGTLRIGVTEMIVHSWLGSFFTALKTRFPNIDVDLTVDVSANLSRALAERRLDLALQNGPFERQTTGIETLGPLPMLWVASPRLELGTHVLSLRDLARHPILTHARGTIPYNQMQEHFAAAPEISVRHVSSSNLAACLQMTRDGLGVACLPEAMLREDLSKDTLRPLRYLWVPDALIFAARFDAETCPSFVRAAAQIAQEVAQTHAKAAILHKPTGQTP